MKKINKAISVILCLSLLIVIIRVATFSSSAVTNILEQVCSGSVQDKINSIASVYPTDSYFTASGNVCYSNQSSDCQLSNIPSRGGLPSGATAANVTRDAWSCCAFARYVFYCTFGLAPENCGTVSSSNAKIGDYMNLGSHYAIYLGQDSTYWYVYDSNYTSPATNIVKYNRALRKSNFSSVQIHHALNYDTINNKVDENSPVDLGTEFYAYIINTAAWKHLTNDRFNVSMRTETGEPNQIWNFQRQGDGSYKIKNCYDDNVLDVHNFGTTDGTNVAVAGSNDTSAQRWYIYGESGAYYLKAKCGDLVLDIAGGSTIDGANVQMWTKNGSSAQKFQIWKLDKEIVPQNLGSDFYAYIINTAYWKHLTVETDNNVVIRKETGCVDQIWKFERQTDGSYKIFNTGNSLSLDVSNGSYDSKANVQVYSDNDSKAQRWYIYGSSGQYHIKARCTSCYLDVAEGINADGTNIQMNEKNDTDAQYFQIWKLEDKTFARNLGENFTAPILNKNYWIPIENDEKSNVVLKKENGKSNQLWRFERQIDGSYIISSCIDGKCLDIENSDINNGANVRTYEKLCQLNQRWYIVERDGGYIIQSKLSGRVLDLCANESYDGTNIQMWRYDKSPAQIFAIYTGDECKLAPPVIDVNTITENRKIQFSWSDSYGESDYVLKIWIGSYEEGKDSDYQFEIPANTTLIEVELPIGDYEACVEANNYFATKNSDFISFYVKEEIFPGDSNSDGTISLLDAVMAQKAALSITTLDEQGTANADINGDGKITLFDAIAIQKLALSVN